MVNLYIKCHRTTFKQYFGKTGNEDVEKYKGNGTYWKRHIAKHGNDTLSITLGSFEMDDPFLVDYALGFSAANDIVASEMWANLQAENGIDGVPKGTIPWNKGLTGVQTPWNKGLEWSEKHRENLSEGHRNMSDEAKRQKSERISDEYQSRSESAKAERMSKKEETCLKKYGYKNSSQDPEIIEKILKTRSLRSEEEKLETKKKMRDAKINRTDEEKEESVRKRRKTMENKPILKCPHCGFESKHPGNMSRWHFENCKQK